MKFTTTYPMVGKPYDPKLVTGDGLRRVAQAAEAAGFSGFGFTDHPAPSQKWLDGGGHDALDPFVAMTWAAAATTTLRLIPNVLVLPYRNPFIVAKAGYMKSEFAALGVAHDERNELFDEAIDVLRAIWTRDDVSFEGKHFTARGVTAHPRPATCPPIWIGGNSAAARQRVADRGDGWAPFPAPPQLAATARTAGLFTLDDLAAALDDLRARLAANGRALDDIDITYSNFAGGDPSSDAFDADTHIEGLRALEALGVTWVQVGAPGGDIERSIAMFERYGEQVISRTR